MSSLPLRVCVVAPLPPPFGGISHWSRLLREFVRQRHDIEMRFVDTAPRWRGVDDLCVWKRMAGGAAQLLRDYGRFLRQVLVRSRRPHVIHLTTSGQLAAIRDLAILCSANRFRIPVVYHLHFGRIPDLARGRSGEWRCMAMAMKRAHTVVALDERTEGAIRGRFPSIRVVRIPNCVDLASLPDPASEPQGERLALFLGWVLPTKGVPELLAAWTRVRPRGWRLRIVGPGRVDYQTQLKERYRPYATDFVGELSHDEAMQAMARASLFILPSHTEAFPMVVIEAMAMGKPILATRVGAIPEMLRENIGCLVEPGDGVGLERALAAMTADAGMRQGMGERARARARQEYALQSVLPRVVGLWHDVRNAPKEDGCLTKRLC